ncbi:MAG: phosphotransferase [Bacteroidetes bacterium]|nr:phosphotransferase [Bacteroidota bacterium]
MILQVPPAEVPIDVDLVKRLVRAQFPEFSHLPVSFLDAGWDNENYRLGEAFVVRLPRRQVAVALLKYESLWLPKIAEAVPMQVPAPVFMGKPFGEYPWHWSIIPWFEGVSGGLAWPEPKEAMRLAAFFKALHGLEWRGAPANKDRGVPLSEKNEAFRSRISALRKEVDLDFDVLENTWMEGLKEPFPSEMCLLHGDPHPRNMVIRDKRIEAIIDWGDITSGDPAGDLAAFWMLFEHNVEAETHIRKALELYGADVSLVKRAKAWAVFYGLILLHTGLHGHPVHAEIGRRCLKTLEITPI